MTALHAADLTPGSLDAFDTDRPIEGLSIAPTAGAQIADYDCCSTPVWVLVGPTLEGDLIGVEIVEMHHYGYHDPGTWEVLDTIEVPSTPDALLAMFTLADDYSGMAPCHACDS